MGGMRRLQQRKVRLRGRSFVMTIPMRLADEFGLRDGEYLACAIVGDKIVLWRADLGPVERQAGDAKKYEQAILDAMKDIAENDYPNGRPPRGGQAARGAGGEGEQENAVTAMMREIAERDGPPYDRILRNLPARGPGQDRYAGAAGKLTGEREEDKRQAARAAAGRGQGAGPKPRPRSKLERLQFK